MRPDESVEPMRASAGLPLLGQVSLLRAEWAEKRAWKFQRFAAWLRKAGYVFYVSRRCGGGPRPPRGHPPSVPAPRLLPHSAGED
jgi:hypothetical protein